MNTTLQSSATSTDNIVVKTIYDPCPAGYTVAPVNAFSGMTDVSGWDSTNKGALVKGCWFPALGYRASGSGALGDVGTQGRAWNAVPYNTRNARSLYFANNIANPADYNSRALGIAVRPVVEIN